MKKFLAFLFFTFFLIKSFAQLDTEHWFAPMAAKAEIKNLQSFLYLSTNETTPFDVQIYNNNTLYTTVQISKGNAQQVEIPGNFLISQNQSDLFTPNSMGLHLTGSKKFFANYRFSITNHGEIITSKGLAGLGKKFFAVMAPNVGNDSRKNSTIGVTATEDNTSVVVSGYNPNIIFSDQSSSPSKSFILNKGQSYIMDVLSTDSGYNLEGLIGAKIESSQPISVTNGNFNGKYVDITVDNSDILMDQSVPVERLGQDFVVVKGNGSTTSGMEKVIVLATEDNTTFSVNGTPSNINLNAGQFYLIPGTSYINQLNANYNMGISSSKNVYVYQLLAGGSSPNEDATGGMNFIPPLNCFLPNNIDEIGFIDKIGNTSYNTKLNIITKTGASVTLNGAAITPNTGRGPYPVGGNPNWVVYSVSNIKGTLTVKSTESVTAGIAAGSGAVGYGGYFAGFSSVPAISKTGDCLNGIILQVDNTYDAYQWFLDGKIIPGETFYSIKPEKYGAGKYTCLITKTSCSSKLTAEFIYTLCPPISTSTFTVGSCGSKLITPTFTNSSQTIVREKTVIAVKPASGTATVDPSTGNIIYTPNPDLTNAVSDTFVYYIEGNGNPADFEYFKVIINVTVLKTYPATLTLCRENGSANFNLSLADITKNSPVTKKYYETLAEAQAEVIGSDIQNPTTYSSAGGQVYAVVKTREGCSQIATITLGFFPEIILNTNLYNAINCDNNLSGTINIDFSKITPLILQNSNYFKVRYYLTLAEANAGTTLGIPNIWSYSVDTNVYIRVDSPDNCPFITGEIDFKIGAKVIIATPVNQQVCSENTSKGVLLSDYIKFFTTDTAVNTKFYKSLGDAKANISGTDILPNQTISADTSYYIRFYADGVCDNIGTLNLKFSQALKSTTLPAIATICEGSTTTLDAGPGFPSYLWSTGETTQSVTKGTGMYTVTLTSANGCSLIQSVEVKESLKAVLNTSDYTAENCDTNFDGNVYVKFSDITPIILPISTGFTVKYFSDQNSANTPGSSPLPDNFSYQTNTTVYVRVESQFCPPIVQPLTLKVGTILPLSKSISSVSECDDDLDNIKSVDLSKYVSQFTTDAGVNVSYYDNLENAKNAVNAVSNPVSVNKTGTYYLRLSKTGFCPVLGTLTINIDIPTASAILQDKNICPATTTTLDAGPGFTSYTWSRAGEKTSFITNVTAGDYYVDLESGNGCIYQQKVSVKNVDLPKITAIDIKGSTITISAEGGNKPYYYSLNGSTPQTSNIFTDVKSGKNIILVTSADQCTAVSKEFSIIIITNVITPNGDNINDTFNYSELKTKDNPKFQIYDRYGKLVFTGSENNNYTWDGTLNNRKLETASYWYILEWQEFGVATKVTFTGWVLLKNTNF